MADEKFEISDVVTVVRYTPVSYAPGVTDELGTEELFLWMVGKDFEILGFDDYGHLELNPRDMDAVWIDPTDVVLKRRKV